MRTKNLINLIALSLLPSISSSVNALENSTIQPCGCNFIEINGGIVQSTDLNGNTQLNTGSPTYTFGAAIGRKLYKQFNIDLEYKYIGKNSYNFGNTTDSNITIAWKTHSNAALLNMSIDLINDRTTIVPYLKFGMGIANNHSYDYCKVNRGAFTTTTTYGGKDTNKFAWQVGAGFDIAVDPMFDVKLQYMYANLGKVQTASVVTSVYSSGLPTTSRAATPKTGKLQEHIGTMGIKLKF
jgi:opacity protein-like surface antigen